MSHLKTVNNMEGIQNKKFACDICSQTFSLKHSIKIHKKTVHEKIRAYQCDLCSKSFLRHSHLTDHKSLKHEDKKFKCEICQKHFGRELEVKRHKISVHPKALDKARTECQATSWVI